VSRQLAGHPLPQALAVDALRGRRDDPCDEPCAPPLAVPHDRDLRKLRLREQPAFHLRGLDTLAAHLDLLVEPAGELE
jgi:hypothetical protein